MRLDSNSPLVTTVPIPTYVELLRHIIQTHDRSVSMPSCFMSRFAVEGSADEMFVTTAVHHWLRNFGQAQSDGSLLAQISRFEQMVYQVTVNKNNLLVQGRSGRSVLVAAYIPNIKVLRVSQSALCNDDVMQFSGMISGLMASTVQKRKQWKPIHQTPGFTNARYAVRG